MRLVYDDVGDILYIDLVEPYEEQESDMISDTVIVRTNPDTARVESLEFLFFSEGRGTRGIADRAGHDRRLGNHRRADPIAGAAAVMTTYVRSPHL